MARVDLRCACGYMFFVSDVQLSKPEGVRCPSCLAPVGISGPAAGGGPPRKATRVLAAEPDRGDAKTKMWIGLAAGGVLAVVGVVFMMFSGGGRRGDEDDMRRRVGHTVPPNPGPRPIAPRDPNARPVPIPAAPAPTPGYTPPPGPAPAPPPGPAPAPVPAPAPAPAAFGPLPEDVVKGLRDEVLTLKEWHRNLAITAPEKTRMDSLIAAGKGEAADVEFLRSLLTGPRVRAVKEEAVSIREALDRLSKEALEGLPVDKVVMNDGRILHGRILEETGDVVKLERKFAGGVAGVMPLPKPTVKDVQKGKGIGGEFKTRWDAAVKGGPAQLSLVLAWCKESTLPLQASLTAYAILSEDPGRGDARQEAGFTADPVARMLEAEKQGGFITYEGRRWVPRELKEKLLRESFAIIDGQWVSRKERMIGVPGLFRYERQDAKPVGISGNGAAPSHDIEYVYTPVQEVASNSWVEKVEMKYTRRFWSPPMEVRQENGWPNAAPRPAATPGFNLSLKEDRPIIAPGTAMRGEVYITIPVGAPILEASVTTAAEVKGTASIVVSMIVEGRRERVYACQSKEDKSHKLPDLIRGKTQVDLVAEFQCQATYQSKVERRKVSGPRKNSSGQIIQPGNEVAHYRLVPDYQATLFSSHSNTVEVFRLTVTSSEPAPGLDKLFENARDVLK